MAGGGVLIRMKRATLALVVAALVFAPSAQATFPGGNGRIAYTWSVGGEAFESGPAPRLVGVFSVRPDGSDRRLIARGGREPVYSPNGRRIAFLRSQRLWVADADGSDAHPVSPRGWLVGEQEWSPRGNRIAFARGFDGSVREVLYSVRPGGGGLDRLVRARMPITLTSGAWSPDGRAIVYEQSRVGRSAVRVFRANAVTNLVQGFRPTWSRRDLIAYETRRAGGNVNEVCMVQFQTDAEPECIGFDDASVTDPTWSPIGHRMMVMHTPQGGGAPEIRTVRPDGSVLTRAPRAGAEFPTFSPNGRLLASTRTRNRDGLEFKDLFVQRLDGTGLRRLVRGGQAQHADWQPRR
jgi:Tol biopolymer transport system component